MNNGSCIFVTRIFAKTLLIRFGKLRKARVKVLAILRIEISPSYSAKPATKHEKIKITLKEGKYS